MLWMKVASALDGLSRYYNCTFKGWSWQSLWIKPMRSSWTLFNHSTPTWNQRIRNWYPQLFMLNSVVVVAKLPGSHRTHPRWTWTHCRSGTVESIPMLYFSVRRNKCCLFPLTCPLQVLLKKSYPKVCVFFTLPTPDGYKSKIRTLHCN